MKTETSTTFQVVLSVAVVLAAAGAVGLYATFGSAGAEPQAMDGHVHGVGAPAGDELRPVRLDAERERRIGVTYATAELRALERTVRTVASVTYDETRIANVSPRIHGWVERIHVDYLGTRVQQGDPLVELYSPELITAQEELLLARTLLEATAHDPDSRAHQNAARLLASAKQRLDYWEIPEDQIALLEASGELRRTLLLRAPSSGVVVEKNAFMGAHVSTGSTLYTVADLSRVWIEGEVFERDVSLVRVGQSAHIRVDAYPGEVFHGRVSYISPTVSVASRTGGVRVELANADGRIKPGMYADIQLDVATDQEAIVVPRTAVISTGTRDVIFVRAKDGTLIPREVSLGLPSGREIVILAGLEPGEIVVSSATFLIDAESNLGAAMDRIAAEEPATSGTEAHMGHEPADRTDPGHEGRTPALEAPGSGHEGHAPAPAAPRSAHEGH